jgi:methylated-DNA-[protein]-cysteine S-methyltransferase
MISNMSKTYHGYYNSEIGYIKILGEKNRILAIDFIEKKPTSITEIPPYLKECIEQLDEYFRGERKVFSVKLKLQGTDFQKKVWNQLIRIPYGETVSYKDIASLIGNPNAVRAVGNANGQNNLAVIIPCHRVIGSNGSLTGYGGGIWRKEWLLKHEQANL